MLKLQEAVVGIMTSEAEKAKAMAEKAKYDYKKSKCLQTKKNSDQC